MDPDTRASSNQLNQLTEEQRLAGAVFTPEVCRRHVADERTCRLDDVYETAYRRIPETPTAGETQIALIGQVLHPDRW